jgi:hypothetical protein
MNTPAKLSDLMMALEFETEEYRTYFDRDTGRTVAVESTVLSAVEEGDEEDLADLVEEGNEELEIAKAIINDDGSRFLSPPDKFDFHEYAQMERFIDSLKNDDIADQLWRAIKGPGAFRYFKDTIHRLGIQEKWYQFRDQAMKQFIIEWAKDNDILFEDDTRKPHK